MSDSEVRALERRLAAGEPVDEPLGQALRRANRGWYGEWPPEPWHAEPTSIGGLRSPFPRPESVELSVTRVMRLAAYSDVFGDSAFFSEDSRHGAPGPLRVGSTVPAPFNS